MLFSLLKLLALSGSFAIRSVRFRRFCLCSRCHVATAQLDADDVATDTAIKSDTQIFATFCDNSLTVRIRRELRAERDRATTFDFGNAIELHIATATFSSIQFASSGKRGPQLLR